MKAWLNGLHLGATARDLDAILNKGYLCFTFLDGESPEARMIKARVAESLVVMRFYVQTLSPMNWISNIPPATLARRLSEYEFEHIIPWNEANLGIEYGSPGLELNTDWRQSIYDQVREYWFSFVPEFRTRCPAKKLHFPAWSPWDGSVGPFWSGADIYDLHLYGEVDQMLNQLTNSLSHIPEGKPVFISEWNFNKAWDAVPGAEINRFMDELSKFPQVIGATAFIWRWENPDPGFANLDLRDSAAADVLGGWGKKIAMEYGFQGLFDGFDVLVAQLGANLVGKPLHAARYIGSDYAYQVTENGRLEAVKLDNGNWDAKFYRSVQK